MKDEQFAIQILVSLLKIRELSVCESFFTQSKNLPEFLSS